MKTAITEKDRDIIQAWYSEEVTDINAFIEKLNKDYDHDYGTICHAIAATAVQAGKLMNKQEQGGITGFQAGAVMWEFMRNWMHLEGPMRLMSYNKMLYPQYFGDFDTVIEEDVWKYLQSEAKKNFETVENAGEQVKAHWKSIVDGIVPFGYVVKFESS
jgi:hypothetical protein